jgi:hypothetical protein
VWESEARQRALRLQESQLRGRLGRAEEAGRRQLAERLERVVGEVQDLSAREPDGERRYVLSTVGLNLLAATRGMPPLAYGRARLWPVGYEVCCK